MHESPVQFNIWSAISAVSATLKDNVYLYRGNYTVFPNQYIVLVSPPGVGKGESMRPAHSFVKNPPSTIPYANYVPDSITVPKLVEVIANGFPRVHFNNGHILNSKDSSCVLMAEELGTLLRANNDMSTFLCRCWDGKDYTYDTKGKGKNVIKDMCVSLIASCTQNFIKDINKNMGAEVNNGFTARTLFVFADSKSQMIFWPKGFKVQQQLLDKLNNDLMLISQMGGEYQISDTAKVLFERKYKEIYDSQKDEGDTDVVKNFKARQAIHILKLAMILSAATNDSMIISDTDMCNSITLVDGVLKTLDMAFGGVGDSDIAESMHRVQLYMAKMIKCPRTQIIRDNRRNITPETLDRVLTVLQISNIVKRYTVAGQEVVEYTGAKP